MPNTAHDRRTGGGVNALIRLNVFSSVPKPDCTCTTPGVDETLDTNSVCLYWNNKKDTHCEICDSWAFSAFS